MPRPPPRPMGAGGGDAASPLRPEVFEAPASATPATTTKQQLKTRNAARLLLASEQKDPARDRGWRLSKAPPRPQPRPPTHYASEGWRPQLGGTEAPSRRHIRRDGRRHQDPARQRQLLAERGRRRRRRLLHQARRGPGRVGRRARRRAGPCRPGRPRGLRRDPRGQRPDHRRSAPHPSRHQALHPPRRHPAPGRARARLRRPLRRPEVGLPALRPRR